MTDKVRAGKTAKDKQRGHIPYAKNRKLEGERGHLHGTKRAAWVKKLSKAMKGIT